MTNQNDRTGADDPPIDTPVVPERKHKSGGEAGSRQPDDPGLGAKRPADREKDGSGAPGQEWDN